MSSSLSSVTVPEAVVAECSQGWPSVSKMITFLIVPERSPPPRAVTLFSSPAFPSRYRAAPFSGDASAVWSDQPAPPGSSRSRRGS